MTGTFYYEGIHPSWGEIQREVEKRYPGYTLQDYTYNRIGSARQTDMQEYHNVYTGSEYEITVKLSCNGSSVPSWEEQLQDRIFFQGR